MGLRLANGLDLEQVCSDFAQPYAARKATVERLLAGGLARWEGGRVALTERGLDRVVASGFATLGLQTYLTAGPMEARAWTIEVGDTAPKAAGVIHTDFERGFIRAEVIAYDDYIAYKGEAGAKGAK